MLPAEHFEGLYAASDDPWNYVGDWYEQRKHLLTLACLPKERYRRAFEPGCSIGVLTAGLAPRCERLVAADMSPTAVHRARQRTVGLANVDVLQLRVPDDWPEPSFDLVVLSELGYYLDPAALDRFVERAQSSLVPGGHLVAVHWTGSAEDFMNPAGARDVHARLRARQGWTLVVGHREPNFIIDVFERTG